VKNGNIYELMNGRWKRWFDQEEIINLYNSGKSMNYISKYFKTDNRNIKKILLDNNTELKSQSEIVTLSMNNDDTKRKLSESYYKSQEKRKQTCLDKFGVEYASQSQEFQNKVKETSFEKYGTEHFLKCDKVQEKRKETCLEKYDVDNVSKIEEVKQKIENTNLEKRGVKSSFQCAEVKSKTKDTLLYKYGVTNPSKHRPFVEKREDTMLSRYGYKNSMHVIKFKNVISLKLKDKFLETFDERLELLNLRLFDTEYIDATYKHNWICTKCKSEFQSSWWYIQQGKLCPTCYPPLSNTSKAEEEVYQFIKNILSDSIEIKRGIRSIIPPKELDIFIPSKNIAIEYNGLYWHSEMFKYNNTKDLIMYHLNKTIECEKKGIRLIHIFEDEWIYNKDIVKKRLEHILNTNSLIKINGRDCIIKIIDSKIKNEFLEKFHIQGSDNSKIKLGAFYNNELISVMTFGKGNISKGSKPKENVWELNRFCSNSSYHIPGIASKLLTYFKRNYQWKEIFSYADRRWSDGNLYNKIGFDLVGETGPNYWYIQNSMFKRIHRFNLRKTKDDPKNIPEWILRQSEGYFRIWDCGSLKFTLTNINKHKGGSKYECTIMSKL